MVGYGLAGHSAIDSLSDPWSRAKGLASTSVDLIIHVETECPRAAVSQVVGVGQYN